MGFMVLDSLALKLKMKFRVSGQALAAKGSSKGHDFVLIKPLSYMNLSGVVVRDYLKRHKDDFFIVVDDVDLPFGTLRLRTKGGDGGHNGLASIIDFLDTEDFARLRIGIGPRPSGIELSDYVLASFSKDEMKELPVLIENSRDAVLLTINEGVQMAMNEINVSRDSGITSI